MRTRRGVDNGSVAMYWLIKDQPVSAVMLNQIRLASAMIRL